MSIELPLFKQEKRNTCALACLRMVLAAFGTQVDEATIEAEAELEEKGTNIVELERLLQLNHDSLVWSNHNRVLMHSLQQIFDTRLMDDLRRYDHCRMQKHHDLRGIERIEGDTRKECSSPRGIIRKPKMTLPTTSTTPDPEMTMPLNQTKKRNS